ncbi:hypothetical protein [uncultured Marinobacter sp.]|uniref:hypothetical protein n=1 Tax=uncultured Marinobacter sp. TaxID=187379 RepID=UPI0030D95350
MMITTFASKRRLLTLPIATLRMLHYPPTAGSTDREDGETGTHSDYGNVTILATDEVAGRPPGNVTRSGSER